MLIQEYSGTVIYMFKSVWS